MIVAIVAGLAIECYAGSNFPGDDSVLLIGQKTIARHCGVTDRTVRNWTKLHGFPMGELPKRHENVTTEEAIAQWLINRRDVRLRLQEEARHG